MATSAYSVTDTRTDKVVFRTDSQVEAYDYADRLDNPFGLSAFASIATSR